MPTSSTLGVGQYNTRSVQPVELCATCVWQSSTLCVLAVSEQPWVASAHSTKVAYRDWHIMSSLLL